MDATTEYQRRALALASDGRSQREIANALGISRDSARDLLTRARRAAVRARRTVLAKSLSPRSLRLLAAAEVAASVERFEEAKLLEMAARVTYREIGEQVGLTRGAIEQRVRRAMNRIRDS